MDADETLTSAVLSMVMVEANSPRKDRAYVLLRRWMLVFKSTRFFGRARPLKSSRVS